MPSIAGFPSNQRNDQRNSSTWLINVLYRKELSFPGVRGAVAAYPSPSRVATVSCPGLS